MSEGIPVVDLFAGAGGFALASKQAGASVRLSVEFDQTCCETLNANLAATDSGHAVEHADVRELFGEDLRRGARLSRTDPLVVVGGPPCQPFSKASYWTDPGHDSKFRQARARGESADRPTPITTARPDERRDLLREFWRLVIESRADGFVMENVRSILHPRNRQIFNDLQIAFHYAGYHTTVVDANAANYGIPQLRKRIFLLGSRIQAPQAPNITHKVAKKDPQHLPPVPGVGSVLGDFAGDDFYEEGETVSGRWAKQLQDIPPGMNYKFHTAWANHPNPIFKAETKFWNFLLKLDPKSPSWTINANPGPWVGPFHWDSRRLRTPELAAIQTFPKGYDFKGNRRARVRQIGNAVPPMLAQTMVSSVMQSIQAGKPS